MFKWFAPDNSKRAAPSSASTAPATLKKTPPDYDEQHDTVQHNATVYQHAHSGASPVIHYTPSMSDISTDYDSDDCVQETPIAAVVATTASRRNRNNSDPDTHYLTSTPSNTVRGGTTDYSMPQRRTRRMLTAQQDLARVVVQNDTRGEGEEEWHGARSGAQTSMRMFGRTKGGAGDTKKKTAEEMDSDYDSRTQTSTTITSTSIAPITPVIPKSASSTGTKTRKEKTKSTKTPLPSLSEAPPLEPQSSSKTSQSAVGKRKSRDDDVDDAKDTLVKEPYDPKRIKKSTDSTVIYFQPMTEEEQEYYMSRAREFLARYQAHYSAVQESDTYKFLLDVQGYANLPIESLVSNWKSVVERPRRVLDSSNLWSIARALRHLEYDVENRMKKVELSSDESFSSSSSSAAEASKYAKGSAEFITDRRLGGVDPPPRARPRPNIRLSDDESTDIPELPLVDPHHEGRVPRDVYRDLADVMPELRQFATEPYVQRTRVDLGIAPRRTEPTAAAAAAAAAPARPVAQLLVARDDLAMENLVGDLVRADQQLNTTGMFRAASHQAELRAAQFNPELQNAKIVDYMTDNNARSLMAQLVAYHITRASTLTPRRDTKMVQLPAINAAIQSVLAQMMYLKWGWDQQAQRRVVQFDYNHWHGVRQERQNSISAAAGHSGCGSMFDVGHSAAQYGSTTGGFPSFYDGYRTYV